MFFAARGNPTLCSSLNDFPFDVVFYTFSGRVRDRDNALFLREEAARGRQLRPRRACAAYLYQRRPPARRRPPCATILAASFSFRLTSFMFKYYVHTLFSTASILQKILSTKIDFPFCIMQKIDKMVALIIKNV